MMGYHRALTAIDLAAARAALRQPKTYPADKAYARRLLEGLRDVRLATGQDGHRLP
jgi:flagellum-specific peptidoglycan hydrolase FlgJ